VVAAADVQLTQGLAQRVTAARLDLVNSEATSGELAWNWGQGRASDGPGRPRRLWFRELSRDVPVVKPGPRAEDWPSGRDAARTAPACPDPIPPGRS
jgi:hypothetical protein